MAARTGLGIALATLALTFGCGGDTGAGEEGGRIELSSSSSLIDLIASAPASVPYDMVRRYEAYWGAGLHANSLIYRERAYGDGDGSFAIEPLEVLEPTMSSNEENLFLLLQKARAGFFFRHRDFAIRDVQRFTRRWQLVDTGVTAQVLGRTCGKLEARRRNNARSVYHLTVDLQNGLVLRSEERDLAGNTLALLEVESLSLTPTLAGVGFHQPISEEFELASNDPTHPRLSFVPVQPEYLPSGYRLARSTAVIDSSSGEAWARFVYTDGVEELFFMHGGGEAAVHTAGGFGKSSGGPAPGRSTDLVKYIEMGVWTVVFGDVRGERFVAMGKLSRPELLDVVESAFF